MMTMMMMMMMMCVCVCVCVFQRLRQVVCGENIEETMSLICSGAKVCFTCHLKYTLEPLLSC